MAGSTTCCVQHPTFSLHSLQAPQGMAGACCRSALGLSPSVGAQRPNIKALKYPAAHRHAARAGCVAFMSHMKLYHFDQKP
jgi:hypothetical protein